MPSLGKAYIEVHADTRPFGRELRDEIDAYLAAAQAKLDKGGTKTAQAFNNSFEGETKKGLETTAREFDNTGKRIEASAKKTGQGIRRGFMDGLDAAMNAINNFWGKAAGLFGKIFNSVPANNIKSFFSNLGGGFSQLWSMISPMMGGLTTVLGIILLITAAIAVLTPLVFELAGAATALAGAGGAVFFAFLPVLDLMHQLSPVMGALTGTTKQWDTALKNLNPTLVPFATFLRGIATTFKNLPLGNLIGQLMGPLSTLQKFVGSSTFRKDWNELASISGKFLNNLLRAFQTPTMAAAFQKFIGSIGKIFDTAINPAVTIFANVLGKVFNDPAFQKAIVDVADILSQIVAYFSEWLDQAVSNGSFDAFMKNAVTLFGDILSLLTAAVGFLGAFLTPQNLTNLDNMVKDWTVMFQQVGDFLRSKKGQNFIHDMVIIVDILGVAAIDMLGIFAQVDSVLRTCWTGAKFLAQIIVGVVISALDGLIAKINLLIDGLNIVAGWANKLPGIHLPTIPHIPSIKAPDWVGLNDKTPSGGGGSGLRMLAQGDVITMPTLAMVGEAGPEVVVPLNDPARARALADQSGLTKMLGQSQYVYVSVDLDGQPFYTYVAKAFSAAGKQLSMGVRR